MFGRAAWIACRDPLLLSDDEAEALLEPALTGPQAKAAVEIRYLAGLREVPPLQKDLRFGIRVTRLIFSDFQAPVIEPIAAAL